MASFRLPAFSLEASSPSQQLCLKHQSFKTFILPSIFFSATSQFSCPLGEGGSTSSEGTSSGRGKLETVTRVGEGRRTLG